MNFNWANELAKNALKTAQKRIDSVLDITPEDEAENEEEANSTVITPFDETIETEKQTEQRDGWAEDNITFYPEYSGTSGQNTADNTEVEKRTSPPEWESQWVQQDVEVVDSEPNPIRDSHHAGLLPHSPCSNSPEELVCSGEERDASRHSESQKHKNSRQQVTDLSVLEESKHPLIIIDSSLQKNEKHHDDTLTLISSDFEVLRPSDSCSMASSIAQKALPGVIPGTSTTETHQQIASETKAESNGSSVSKQPINSEIAHLRMQLQYQERRIRDLQFQNHRLEAKAKELLTLKAARTQQSSTEAKLMKKLSDKESELADLLQEGEKLAEMNGKLTKELKKLRVSLNEQEQLAKKGAEAEIDRDLAREEVRGLTAEATKLRNMVKSLEADLTKLKVTNEGVMSDLKKKDDKINKLMADLQQSEATRELAYEEMKRLETVVEEVSSKAEQKEMSSKSVEEITRGLNADLKDEKKKNEQQATYIDSLEKRLGEMMETQRNNAEMIAAASAPLLDSIQRLEAEVSVKESECEQLVQEKETAVNIMQSEKKRLSHENMEIRAKNEKGENMESECVASHSGTNKESNQETRRNFEESKEMKTRADFIFLNELGEGSFSTVYHVKERSTGREFAAKVCLKKQIVREKKIDYIFREKEALIRLTHGGGKHPFIVQLLCTFQDTDNLYIVMTLAKKGDLLKLLRKSGGKFDLNVTRFYSSEIVVALEHMHALKIIHRDLKPENILISETGHILVSDFGSAKILDRIRNSGKQQEKHEGRKRRSSFVGTAQFVSPEVLKGEPVQQACDYWALGAIIYQLLTGRHAFHDVCEYLIYRRITDGFYKVPDDFPEIAANLLKKLLVVKVEDRLGSVESGGAEAVKKEPFFSGVRWETITETEAPLLPCTSHDR